MTQPAEGAAGRVQVFQEVQRLATASGLGGPAASAEGLAAAQDVASITAAELEEVRRLARPPPVVRRTLEATALILNAARVPAPVAPPEWRRVQRRIAEDGFVHDILHYDLAQLRAAPILTSFVAARYFGVGLQAGPPAQQSRPRLRSRAGGRPEEQVPLTFARVRRANRAAAALFGWCADVLVRAGVLDAAASGDGRDSEDEESPAGALTEVPLGVPPEEPGPAAQRPDPEREGGSAALLDESGPPPRQQQRQDQEPGPSAQRPDPEQREGGSAALLDESGPPPRQQQRQDQERAESPEPPDVRGFRLRRLLAAWSAVARAAQPDRHFEALVWFCVGCVRCGSRDQLPMLRGVAAVLRRRPRLQLRLVGCRDVLEGDLVAADRLRSTQRYFESRGIPVGAAECGTATATIQRPAGIECHILLSGDRQLRDYFRCREAVVAGSTASESSIAQSVMLLAASSMLADGVAEGPAAAACRGLHAAWQVLEDVRPAMTLPDLLWARWLETNFQTCRLRS